MTWLPYFTTSALTAALIAGVLWLLRNWILTRLTASVQHDYDKKLEALRTELKKSEEQFKTDLRAREAELAAIRGGALTNITVRQTALAQRRIEAVDCVWAATVEGAKFNMLLMLVQIFNIPALVKAGASDKAKIQQILEALGKTIPDIENIDGGAAKHRPYISELAWAYFNAYTSIIGMAFATFKILEVGEDPNKFLAEDKFIPMLKSSLPDWTDYIDKCGLSGAQHLADELKKRLLAELQNVLAGKEEDQADVARAAEILKASEEVQYKRDEARAAEIKTSIS